MSKKNFNLDTAVFYTSAICNLKCNYCSIDKNESLIKIDKYLAESFENYQYYLDRVKKYFPHRDSLTAIETWGGEPFLGMKRFYPLMHALIKEYPFLNSFFSSTNFAFPNWDEYFLDLMKQFGQYPNRRFEYSLQISCDGPEHINDLCRGQGVTKKCLDNFDKLLTKIENNLPPNVLLTIGVKPTLSLESLEYLKTKEDIIKYYQFFEEAFIYKVKKLGFVNVIMEATTPNLAVPILATKKDGQNFALFCKYCREIEQENDFYHYFKYYNNITLFTKHSPFNYNMNCHHSVCNSCGSCKQMIGFMPGNMISICHEGFTEFLTTYKKEAAISPRLNTGIIEFDKFIKEAKIRLCISDDQYEKQLKIVEDFGENGAETNLATTLNLIFALALADQIEKKYLNYENALKAAIEFQSRTPLCYKDNYNVTGSASLIPVGLLKMFLNGALDYIVQGDPLNV